MLRPKPHRATEGQQLVQEHPDDIRLELNIRARKLEVRQSKASFLQQRGPVEDDRQWRRSRLSRRVQQKTLAIGGDGVRLS
jgi:hypothetical protein